MDIYSGYIIKPIINMIILYTGVAAVLLRIPKNYQIFILMIL